MPHTRKRYLEKALLEALSASTLVGVLGQRQTGKTTLIEKNAQEYVTLDEAQVLEKALKTPHLLIANRKSPFGIDECQESPALFPALKEWVRTHKAPGQFILTGSVRFTSIEEIRESLTGRIIDLHLLPLTLSETHHSPLWNITRVAHAKNPLVLFEKNPFSTAKQQPLLHEFLLKGGLPGICFVRSGAMRNKKFSSHIKTILDRDLRKVTRTQLDYLTLKVFLEEVALQQGNVFDLSQAARGARIALNTAKKILAGLESVFLLRSILKHGDTEGRMVYLEDQGMATFLLQERGIILGPKNFRISDWNRFLFQQLFAQLNYQMESPFQISAYQTRGGAWMDFVVQIQGQHMAYSVTIESSATSQQFKSSEIFLKHFPNAKVFLLHQGESFRKISEQVYELPLRAVV